MHDYHRSLDPGSVVRCELNWGEVAGRSGQLASQGAPL
jgi:hypothetical protein